MANDKSLAIAKVDNYLNSPEINGLITSMMQGAAKNFLADVRTLCFNNPALAECEQSGLLGCALKAHALGLRLDPSFGQSYIIPYKKSVQIDGKWEKVPVAQFQLGVRGWIQLAMRTREYSKLNAMTVKEGEFTGRDVFGDPILTFLPEKDRVKAPVSGYMAAFRMVNGMEKILYWSIEEFEQHAQRFSQAYREYRKNKKADNVWATSYDQMGEKTVLTHLLRKYGYMSAEMQEAYRVDQAAMTVDAETGEITGEYVDNQIAPPAQKLITPDQMKKLVSLVGRDKAKQEVAGTVIKTKYHRQKITDITEDEFDALIDDVSAALVAAEKPEEESYPSSLGGEPVPPPDDDVPGA